MSEVEIYQPSAAVAMQDAAVHRIGEWAESARAASTVAAQLVQSSFVPAVFRGKPIEATAAILAGAEVGLSPMASLRSFDIIQGQAAPRALTLRAIVQSFGHEIVVVESTSTKCRVKARRRGSSEWQSVLWTIEQAKDMGLTGKDNWRKQPAAMLVARATSAAARLVAADAILGIGYSAEEVADGVDVTLAPDPVTAEPTPDAPATKRYSRRKPEPEPEPDPAPEPTDSITEPQMKKLHALLRDLGLDRDAGLARISEIVGAEVTSTKDLSKSEASVVIDTLEVGDPLDIFAGDPDA